MDEKAFRQTVYPLSDTRFCWCFRTQWPESYQVALLLIDARWTDGRPAEATAAVSCLRCTPSRLCSNRRSAPGAG